MLESLFSDTLWIYTSIFGALLGAAFLAYFKDTYLGIWAYHKFDEILDLLRDRYGWTWFDQPEDGWRKKYPHITNKIDSLEKRIKYLEKEKAGEKLDNR